MALAALSDVNVHLPYDKLKMEDGYLPEYNIDAQRLIVSRLSGTFTTAVIDLWVDPANTPDAIRRIAGMLIAAKFYAKLVAEDDVDGSKFAQDLYDQAIAELNAIREGTVTVVGVDGEPLDSSSLSSVSFWPNNTTEPSFAVADNWS